MSKKRTIDESQRVGGRGASVSIAVTADPLELELDVADLLAEPAQAMASSIERGIRAVSAAAAPSTVRQRRAKGISSTKRWNATGRLARSIGAERTPQGYAIVTADDRLQRDDLAEQLADDVPELDELAPEVDAALERAADELVTVRRR